MTGEKNEIEEIRIDILKSKIRIKARNDINKFKKEILKLEKKIRILEGKL